MKKIIVYDFDGTLTPCALPKWEILEKCGLKNGALDPKFSEMAKEKAKIENIDLYKALYEAYFQIIKNAGFSLVDDHFCLGAENVVYRNNVENFLSFFQNNHIHNYLLSSGLKAYLERTTVANFFTKIYATTFLYNRNGEAVGIDYLMSDKNKVEAIKDITKSLGNQGDNCQNVIYIGDGFTDYYAMEYVKSNGGTSIFVYEDKNSTDLKRLEESNVVSFSTYADFSENSELSNYVKNLCFEKEN